MPLLPVPLLTATGQLAASLVRQPVFSLEPAAQRLGIGASGPSSTKSSSPLRGIQQLASAVPDSAAIGLNLPV
eukprot:m.886060 g.886060  ORF g.886060 m.886060 type:complete len:73 (-) comp59905_c2_seq1:112-330(-)